MRGETYERRKPVDLAPLRYPGVDYSIPDHHDHQKHLADVFKASPRGFLWAVRRTA